ncbi:MAG: PD-(D/E)XK nuclease family protein [Bacteroidales bacterium]|nr:PD-(D/E)XK nuclease family protein [Bacteroidales bacterium]
MNLPNLFDFATSELSQDAFICWLASWANPALKVKDGALHATATAFLDRLLEVGRVPKWAEYHTIEIHRQWKDIDVLIVLNGDTAIIIEDKTDTKDHSGQLRRYQQAVGVKFPADRIASVYLKTGDQGTYKSVDEAGYGRFLRRQFLDILEVGERDEELLDLARTVETLQRAESLMDAALLRLAHTGGEGGEPQSRALPVTP